MHEKSEREVTTAIRTIIKFKAFVVKYKLKAFELSTVWLFWIVLVWVFLKCIKIIDL